MSLARAMAWTLAAWSLSAAAIAALVVGIGEGIVR